MPAALLQPDPEPRAGTLKRLLAQHLAFAHWNDDQLRALEGHCRIRLAGPEEPLLKLGSSEPFVHFLLDGCLKLVDGDGMELRIDAGHADSGYPIARLRPAIYSLRADPQATVLEVEQSVLRRLGEHQPKQATRARFDLYAPSSGGSWQEHPLVAELDQAITEQRLSLPVIPAIALKVRRALASDDFQLSDLARIISVDPVISAKLLRLANSPLFRGMSDCDSLQTAVVRLGVDKVQNLVLALSTEQLFRTDAPQIRSQLASVWRHLLDIGTLSAALARVGGKLSADVALLTGLLHEVGKIPLLERASRYADLMEKPGLLEDILAGMGPVVSVATLTQWRLPKDLIAAARHQQDWSHEHDGDTSYGDLLIVAHLYAPTEQHERSRLGRRLPRLQETPAFARVTGARLTAAESLQVIEEARRQTGALRALLS